MHLHITHGTRSVTITTDHHENRDQLGAYALRLLYATPETPATDTTNAQAPQDPALDTLESTPVWLTADDVHRTQTQQDMRESAYAALIRELLPPPVATAPADVLPADTPRPPQAPAPIW
ncbi:hypothetical protein [Streptomyces sp. CAU 1734]|uniref:hypothetical protein n=1 Tax=Streptomyces sp. CAU 1734 TaxID=3140360 RepID=UPI003260AFAF